MVATVSSSHRSLEEGAECILANVGPGIIVIRRYLLAEQHWSSSSFSGESYASLGSLPTEHWSNFSSFNTKADLLFFRNDQNHNNFAVK